MKVIQLKCPSCGGEVEAEDDLEVFYCKYCGQKIILSEQQASVVGAKVINRILEHRERMYDKRAAERREQQSERNKSSLIAIAILLAIFILSTIMMMRTGG